MITEKKINCLDVTINYVDEGEGIPMVFIHNGGGFLQIWLKQIEHFRKVFRVIALDLPGFGESSESNSPYTIDYYSQILEAFLKNLGIDKMIMVGNCIGASLAIRYKNRFPDKIIKLVLINICPGERLIPLKLFRTILFRVKSQFIKKTFMKIVCFSMTKTPLKKKFPDILFARHPDKKSYVYQKYIIKYKEPRQTRSRINLLFASNTFTLRRILDDNSQISDSLLIWGEFNKVASLEKEGYYHCSLCGIQTINIIKGGGHLLMYEFPDQTNKLISDYLES